MEEEKKKDEEKKKAEEKKKKAGSPSNLKDKISNYTSSNDLDDNKANNTIPD